MSSIEGIAPVWRRSCSILLNKNPPGNRQAFSMRNQGHAAAANACMSRVNLPLISHASQQPPPSFQCTAPAWQSHAVESRVGISPV